MGSIPIFGKKEAEGDQVMAVINLGGKNNNDFPIIGRRGDEQSRANGGVLMLGSGNDIDAPQQRELNIGSALVKYVEWKTFGSWRDKWTTLTKDIQRGIAKELSKKDIASLVPSEPLVRTLVDIWEVVLTEAGSGQLQPINSDKNPVLAAIMKRATDLRNMKKPELDRVLYEARNPGIMTRGVPLGQEAFADRVEVESEKRTKDMMEGRFNEYPGPISEEERNYARTLYTEWGQGASLHDINKMLYGFIRMRTQNVVAQSMKSQRAINFRSVERFRQAFLDMRSTPVFFFTDPRTAGYLLEKDDAERLKTQLWTILPSGILVYNPELKKNQVRLTTWSQISFAGGHQPGTIELTPSTPPWVLKLQKSGGSILGAAATELSGIGGLIKLDSLGEVETVNDNLGMLPVRSPDGIIAQMRRLSELADDLQENTEATRRSLSETEMETGTYLRPNKIRLEYKRMVDETRQNQRDVLLQRMNQVRQLAIKMREPGSGARRQDIERIHQSYTKMERNLEAMDKGRFGR